MIITHYSIYYFIQSLLYSYKFIYLLAIVITNKSLLDVRCDNLSRPANGEITSCNSGIKGVGYEGDTCSFTCNTGYELTGSDTRICQMDGNWDGTDVACRRSM